jgi:WD40 repeat protein
VDATSGEISALETSPRKSYSGGAFAPAGRVLFVTGGGFSTDVQSIWNLDRPGRERLDLQWGRATVLCAEWSPDGRWLAVGDNDGVVRLWPWPALLEYGGLA